jgi:hypothetical protein
VAVLAVPSAMAYVELARLSPIAGPYALIVPAIAYVAPEVAFALLVTTTVASLADGDPGTYALLAGMLAVILGVFSWWLEESDWDGSLTTSRAPFWWAISAASRSSSSVDSWGT